MHLPPLLLGVRKLVSPKGGIPLEKEPQGTLGGTHERDSGGSGDFDREAEAMYRRYAVLRSWRPRQMAATVDPEIVSIPMNISRITTRSGRSYDSGTPTPSD